jgi:hypothetical protein
MSPHIQGVGWVTPAGRDIGGVFSAIRDGCRPPMRDLKNPFSGQSHPVLLVDPATVEDVTRLPRLRRSSAISHFAVAAALDAIKASGYQPGSSRLALVFASTNGGVIHTRRFFSDVSKAGPHAGSPLLFPETVYNAPASHIAAALGITGTTLTLVGDSTAGTDALAAAIDLLASDACDHCLVVAAEEADWTLCEAYMTWGLSARNPEGTASSGSGAIFSEGAAALLLGTESQHPTIEDIRTGTAFRSLDEARSQMAALCADMDAHSCSRLVSGSSGARFDIVESELPAAIERFAPKLIIGEAFAASTLIQTACAAISLPAGARALVPTTGYHGQVAALTVRG